MKLSTKGRFAVTAMIDLALRAHAGPVALAGISQRQSISQAYLEQLFAKLRKANLVQSQRGPGGGYLLPREINTINIAEIVHAVDEPFDATQCGGKENCLDEHRCLTHDLWARLNVEMERYLQSVTLGTLVAEQRAKLEARAARGHVRVLRDLRDLTEVSNDWADDEVGIKLMQKTNPKLNQREAKAKKMLPEPPPVSGSLRTKSRSPLLV